VWRERCVPSVVLFQNEKKNSKKFQPKTQTDTRTHAHREEREREREREGRRKKMKQRKETRGYDSTR